MKMKSIVSLSGGMDSATVLQLALSESDVVEAIGFTYGSKHNKYENQAAREVAAHYQVTYRLIDLSGAMRGFRSNLLQTGGDIPEGHYEDQTMNLTVVPGRNLIFASILAGVAWSKEAAHIYLGVHAGDHAIYPDCREPFIRSLAQTIRLATAERVSDVLAPFIDKDKEDILAYGIRRKVPYELTRTCYKDQPIACGKCGSCQERLAAFAAVGMLDPIEYESREILPRE